MGAVQVGRNGKDMDAALESLGKEARKAQKQLQKHQRDQVRRIDGWEQYRTLWDSVDFKRQLINMGDKKVRFALVIMGALNAALLIVLTRGPVVRVLPEGVRIWVALLLVVYGIVTFLFMAHAIEALRPQPEARLNDDKEWKLREESRPDPGTEHRPVGLIIRGPLQQLSFEEEKQVWSEARLCDINAELILFNRTSSFVLTHQMMQLRKVYTGLKVLAILCALVLALLVGTGVVRGGAVEAVTNDSAPAAPALR